MGPPADGAPLAEASAPCKSKRAVCGKSKARHGDENCAREKPVPTF